MRHSSCVSFRRLQQGSVAPTSACLFEHSLFFVFFGLVLIVAIPMVARWRLTVVLICISRIIGDVEHLFTC